ncbi:hypothetical protein HAX54_022045 [Datura stramonium]|uniref:Uncharacterized protein n=1 Tax=Datura stramonium TaxID=4076 RepID=A0ABS8UV51_DATST|nr:hypothetical protein [Datura stramonium]
MRSMARFGLIRKYCRHCWCGAETRLLHALGFAHEGYTVAILARDLGRLSRFADEIAREAKAQKSLTVSSVGAFHCSQQVLPGMVEREEGTILFTGCSASLSGIAGYSDLCCGKFAMSLIPMSGKEFQPLGVHVAHVIITASSAVAHPAPTNRWMGRRGVDGPRRAGPDILAFAHPRSIRLDPRD